MNSFTKIAALFSFACLALCVASCGQDEEPDPSDPEVIEAPFASFNYTIDEVNTLMVSFTNASIDGKTYTWDFGDGTDLLTEENPTYGYKASGTYTVTLTVTNEAGSDEFTDELTVSGFSDNLIQNGEFSSLDGWTSTALWTAEDNATLHGLSDEEFMFKNDQNESGEDFEFSNHMLYTAIELIPGESYKLEGDMRSPSGTNGVWFEVYLLDEEPTEEPDGELVQFFVKSYGEGEACGGEAFDGKMLEVAQGCSNNGFSALIDRDGMFTVSAADVGADNTAYLVFKVGSGWGPDGSKAGFLEGIFIDNVSLKQAL